MTAAVAVVWTIRAHRLVLHLASLCLIDFPDVLAAHLCCASYSLYATAAPTPNIDKINPIMPIGISLLLVYFIL